MLICSRLLQMNRTSELNPNYLKCVRDRPKFIIKSIALLEKHFASIRDYIKDRCLAVRRLGH